MLYDRVLRALQESHQTVEMVDQIGQTLEKTGAEVAEDIRSYCRPNVGAPDAPRWVASRDAQGQKEVFLICSHSKESLEEARIYMALFEKDRLTNLEILEIPQQRLLEIIAKNSTAQLNSNIHSLNPNIGYFAEPQLKFSGWSGIKLTANDAFLAGTFAATLAGLYKQNQDSRAQDANNPDVKTSTIGRILGSMVLRRRADIRTTF